MSNRNEPYKIKRFYDGKHHASEGFYFHDQSLKELQEEAEHATIDIKPEALPHNFAEGMRSAIYQIAHEHGYKEPFTVGDTYLAWFEQSRKRVFRLDE